MNKKPINEADSDSKKDFQSVTPTSVVRGLGYPNGREETSPSPLGWLVPVLEIVTLEKRVSRETSR